MQGAVAMNGEHSRNIGMVGALLLAAAAFVSDDAQAARWGADYFPNVALTTQDGKTVRFYDDLLKDKVVAVDLIYTHCKYSCPLETARLAQVQRLLGDRVGKDVFLYSITLDPERDTPEVLQAYAEKFHAGPGWLFLTGKKEDIKLVSRKLGLLSLDDTPVNRDGHTPELMVGNVAAGTWMRNSALDDPRLLATFIGSLLAGPRAATPEKTYAQARELHVSKGQYLFTTRCAACHTIGHGDGVGPDLSGVIGARDRGWLTRFIQFPDRALEAGDPLAHALFERYNRVNMPNLHLGPEDVASVIEYLELQSEAAPAKAGAPARPEPMLANRRKAPSTQGAR
jgi:protein SCO1